MPAGMDRIGAQQEAARLLDIWSAAHVGGETLPVYLQVRGWPLWSVISAEFAVYRVGPALMTAEMDGGHFRRLKHAYFGMRQQFRIRRGSLGRKPCAEIVWPSAPAAVFLGFSAYMLRDVLLPVIQELSRDNHVPPVVLSDCGTDPRSYNGRIAAHEIGGYVRAPQWPWQTFLDARGGAAVREAHRELRNKARFLLTGSRLSVLVDECREDQRHRIRWHFEWLLRYRLPEILPIIAAAERLFDEFPVSLVVSPDVADPRTRAFVLSAKSRGIPTLELQFGTYGPESVEWHFFLADLLAVWGSRPREVIAAHGVPSDRMVITGSPRHDCAARVDPVVVAATRLRLGAGSMRPLVLFASTHTADTLCDPDVIRRMKRAVFSVCAGSQEVRLAVKPHPLEDMDETRRLAPTGADILFLDPTEDIRGLVAACDVFISTGSTATLDALLAGKPVICLNFPGWEAYSDLFALSGATIPARNADEVRLALLTILPPGDTASLLRLEQGRRRFVKEWAHRIDGAASSRVAALARSLARTVSP